jgi:hypothetical protein
MSKRTEIYLLMALGIVLGIVLYYSTRGQVTGASGVHAENLTFRPLDVQEPHLHTDRLDRLRKLEYSGPHRNIFVALPPRVAQGPAQQPAVALDTFVGPKPPPPPPPLQIPAELYGYATRGTSGKKIAFFSSGDDVLVVAEGDTFLGRYRLVRIGNDTAEVEELDTGRRTTVPMAAPDQTGGQ